MANRRMFSLDVVATDKFLDLPISAQCLYFHLGMRADDDGFISSPKQIMKMVSCTQGDIKILAENGFIIPFESGIIVIRHWKQHNYIQADRYKPTRYFDERKKLELIGNVYEVDTENLQAVYDTDTQVRLGKVRVRDSIEIVNTICPEPDKSAPDLSGIKLPLNDKSFYDVPLDKIALWKETYQAVDVEQELKKMAAWLDSNPTRRKTRRGITKFINGWLSRQQDSGRNYKASGQYQDGRQQVCEGGKAAYSAEEQAMYDKYLGKGDIPGADEIWG